MIRDVVVGLEARRAHQAFQEIKPVESKLVHSVGITNIASNSTDDKIPFAAGDSPSMVYKTREHPAAPAIDSSR